MRSARSSNDDARVPDPSILTPPAGQSGDLQGTTKLECRYLESSAATSNVKLMTTARTRHVDPEELHRSPAFTQGVIAPAARTLYVGGPARHR